MTDEQFWQIINSGRQPTGLSMASPSAHPLKLRGALASLTDEDLSAFCGAFYSRLCDLNRWELWAAGYIIAGGMSDDSFHYFRSWVIGKGQDAYIAALKAPATLGDFIATAGEDIENEELEYVALELLERRGIRFDPRESVSRSADDEPEGMPFDEDTVGEKYPRLSARFGSE